MNDNTLDPVAVVGCWLTLFAGRSARRADPVTTFEKLQKRAPSLAPSDLAAGADAAKAMSSELRALQHRLAEIERRKAPR